MTTFILIALLVASISLNIYLLFYNTLNKLQAITWLRIYWLVRDIGGDGDPHFSRAFMRQNGAPFWRGQGIQFRRNQYVFQIGILTGKGMSRLDQLDGREMDDSPKEIRQWG
jgi:hypothetical protein